MPFNIFGFDRPLPLWRHEATDRSAIFICNDSYGPVKSISFHMSHRDVALDIHIEFNAKARIGSQKPIFDLINRFNGSDYPNVTSLKLQSLINEFSTLFFPDYFSRQLTAKLGMPLTGYIETDLSRGQISELCQALNPTDPGFFDRVLSQVFPEHNEFINVNINPVLPAEAANDMPIHAAFAMPAMPNLGLQQRVLQFLTPNQTRQQSKTPIQVELDKLIELDPSMEEYEFDDNFLCNFSLQLMIDPVITTKGNTYDRTAIVEWFRTHDTDPHSNERLNDKTLIPNLAMRRQILEHLQGLQKEARERLAERNTMRLGIQ